MQRCVVPLAMGKLSAVKDPGSLARINSWHTASRYLGFAVLLLGASGFAGWLLRIELLQTAVPGLPPIKINTALGLISLGLALSVFWRRGDTEEPRAFRVASIACAIIAATFGLATLAEYMSGVDLRIGGSLFGSSSGVVSRMSPMSAMNLVLIGAALIFVQRRTARAVAVAQTLATATLLTSSTAIIGYLYGVNGLYGGASFSPVSLVGGLAFFFAALAILFGSAQTGWIAHATSARPGGFMLRQLIPVTLLVALALGWLRVHGEVWGWFSPAMGTSLLILAVMVTFSIAIWSNSRTVDRLHANAEERREWLRVTLASIGDAVIATDSEGNVAFLNGVAESLTGWQLAAAQGKPIETVFDIVNERSGECVVCPIRDVLRDGRTVELSNHTALRSADGKTTGIEDSAAPIKDAAGNVIGAVMVFRDVTEKRRVDAERKRADLAVRRSEEQYRLLFNSMEEGFCTVEVLFDERQRAVDYRFIEINTAFEKQTGVVNAKGRRIREIAPEMEQHWFETFGRIALTGVPERFENRAEPLGRTYEVNAFRVGPAEDRRVGIVFNDITDRKAREQQVREAGERFRFMAESMPQKIFTATPSGEVNYFNRQWTEFTGLTFEQIRDWGWVQFIHPDDVDENVRRWKQSLESGEPFYFEHRFRRADGMYRWHVSRAHAMRDSNGEVLMWIGSNTDVNDIREAREQAERLSRTKDDFMAALSHELRTPLTPVLMTAAVLRDDARLPLDVREQLAMMKRNIDLEARLIDDLLDLTRIAHGKLTLRMEPCDTHSLIALAVEMVRSEASAKRLVLELDLRAGHAQVMGDPARLQQVFWNLLKNAVKFTPESGHLSVRSVDHDHRLTIEVIDTGVGFTAESAEAIFLPFEQAAEVKQDGRFGGLGLGLSISRAILDLHGGEIHAQSPGPGQGATFRIELPWTDAPVTRAVQNYLPGGDDVPARTQPIQVAPQPLRILLVEDHEATIQVLRQLLTRAGHHVTTAMTVGAALEAARNTAVDLVISDLGLPDGTGFELMHTLRENYQLRGIALSGYGMDEDLRRSSDAGFAAHLTKPVDFGRLQQAIAELCRAEPAPA
jgi:PAS domain S-box-containing protein